jgi:hypothetical protein
VAFALPWLVACSKSATPTQPQVKLPPSVVAVEPEARATGIWYDTDIWAEFSEPLDSTTVNEHTVFLKQDTYRLSARVRWDSATRRIVVTPLVPLPLARTLTVELDPDIATLDGGHFGDTYFWQFKTNGVRRVVPTPADGSTFESPSRAILWTPTESSAGTIQYLLYVSSDSAQVAARAMTPRVSTRPYYLPVPKWGEGAKLYWSVRVTNQTTGESLDTPVWRFDTVPAGTEVDSVAVPFVWWGYIRRNLTTPPPPTCSPAQVLSSSDYITEVRWALEAIPRETRIATVRMYASSPTAAAVSRAPTLIPTLTDSPFCDITYTAQPYPDFTQPITVAGGSGSSPVLLHWEGDFFTAHVQAAVTQGGFYGYMMSSLGSVAYLDPHLMVLFYRIPPAVAARVAAR